MEKCIDMSLSDDRKRFCATDTIFQIQGSVEGFRCGKFRHHELCPILKGLVEESVCFVQNKEFEVLKSEARGMKDMFC